uniref:Dihydroxy-acid dehydratase n=1 Tax=Lygus hesperus TaxID=30085 RepID=A0A0A9XTY8_LYGHE
MQVVLSSPQRRSTTGVSILSVTTTNPTRANSHDHGNCSDRGRTRPVPSLQRSSLLQGIPDSPGSFPNTPHRANTPIAKPTNKALFAGNPSQSVNVSKGIGNVNAPRAGRASRFTFSTLPHHFPSPVEHKHSNNSNTTPTEATLSSRQSTPRASKPLQQNVKPVFRST